MLSFQEREKPGTLTPLSTTGMNPTPAHLSQRTTLPVLAMPVHGWDQDQRPVDKQPQPAYFEGSINRNKAILNAHGRV
eukprot:1133966-Pelagomonas_calceolata.AAC.5